VKKQKKKELALLEEKRVKEEEMLFVQGNYTSLQQEVESMREIMGKLRDKYKRAQAEIKDLNSEHAIQKAELLDIVRAQEK
jgi:molecular chaperone GrpE (heat shock protein)